MSQLSQQTGQRTSDVMIVDGIDSEKTPSLTSFVPHHSNATSAKLSLQDTYIENTGLNSVLCKRGIYNFRPETKMKLASLSEELFQLKIKQKMLLRKESEVDYQLQDAILQEDYYHRSNDIAQLAALQNDDEVDDIARLKEARLFQEMMEITYMRNQLLIDLDIEKLREEEEDKEILEEYYSLKKVWQQLQTQESRDIVDVPKSIKKLPQNNARNDNLHSRLSVKNRRKVRKMGCVLI